MCLSPHEMTSKRIEEIIDSYNRILDSGSRSPAERKIMTGRREKFLQVLKERAENGTYNIDPVPDGSW